MFWGGIQFDRTVDHSDEESCMVKLLPGYGLNRVLVIFEGRFGATLTQDRAFLVKEKGWFALEITGVLVRLVCFATEARYRLLVEYNVEEVNMKGDPQTLGIRNFRSSRNELNITVWSQRKETCGSLDLIQYSGYLIRVKK